MLAVGFGNLNVLLILIQEVISSLNLGAKMKVKDCCKRGLGSFKGILLCILKTVDKYVQLDIEI